MLIIYPPYLGTYPLVGTVLATRLVTALCRTPREHFGTGDFHALGMGWKEARYLPYLGTVPPSTTHGPAKFPERPGFKSLYGNFCTGDLCESWMEILKWLLL